MPNIAYYQDLYRRTPELQQQFATPDQYFAAMAPNDQALQRDLSQSQLATAGTPGGPANVFTPTQDRALEQATTKAISAADPNTSQFQVGDQTGFSDTATQQNQNRTTAQDTTSQQNTAQNVAEQTATVGQTDTTQKSAQDSNTLGFNDIISGGTTAGKTTDVGTTAQNQVSANQQTTAGTQTGTIGSETGVVDTLGFGGLLKDAGQQAVAADTSRTDFLSGLINNGANSFQNQIDATVNRSLSGPGMQGVGDGAKGRVAGAAVGDVVRNQVNQQLQAAQQLAGPSAVTTVAGAANPYLGQTNNQTQNLATTQNQVGQGTVGTTGQTTNTGTTAGQTTGYQQGTSGQQTAQTGSQSGQTNSSQTADRNTASTGEANSSQRSFTVDDLVNTGREISNAFGSSRSAGSGVQPEGGGGGGMWVICTELHRQGLMPTDEWRAGTERAEKMDPVTLAGYHRWARPYARLMTRSKVATRLIEPLARLRNQHLMGRWNLVGWLTVVVGEPICNYLGRTARKEVTV